MPTGLVSWWRAEGNTADFSGLNPGILVDNATTVTGFAGSAFSLDGAGDAVLVGTNASLQLQDFTIERTFLKFNLFLKFSRLC